MKHVNHTRLSFLNKVLGLIAVCILWINGLNAQLAYWDPTGQSGFGVSPFPPTSTATNVTVTGLVRGAGVATSGTAAGNAWGGNGWDGAANDDITWTMVAHTGYQQSFSGLAFRYRRSGTGPQSGTLQYAVNGGSYTTIGNLDFSSQSTSGAIHPTVNLSLVTELQNVPAGTVIKFRIAPAAGSGATGTFYIYTGSGGGLTVSGTVTPLPLDCDIPANLAENNVTANEADFNWDADGTNDFEYVLSQSAAIPTGSGTAINGTSYSTSTLNPLTDYYFYVRQNCGNGNFSEWTMVNFTTLPLPCTVVTNLTSSNIDHESTDLSWDVSTGSTFEYVLDENSATPTGAGTSTTNVTHEATGLSASTTYYFHIRKDCGNGNYSEWETISFTTSAEPCLIVENIASSNVDHASADLSWDMSTGSTFEYVLDENSAAPTGTGIPTTDVTHEATGLSASTTYYFHIRKDCGNGNYSEWETIFFTTSVEPCLIVENIASSNVDHASADLSWDMSTGSAFEYVLDENSALPTGTGMSTTDVTYEATGLNASTTYYFHIRKDCGNGNYSEWETISFTTSVEPCLIVENIVSSNVDHASADLSWDVSTGSTFEYVLDENSATPTGTGIPTTDVTHEATGLSASTTYYFHIRKDCGNGNYSEWETISFTTSSTVGIKGETTVTFALYPNPAVDQVVIHTEKRKGIVSLMSVSGENLKQINLFETEVLDLFEINSGVYLLVYELNGNKSIERLIVQ
ncbi:MAG: T9SS type A sorting domain-containing protein [Crocinitomicaceae bacterium]|nr:T9SS type A sorting domain-containing protein [Crocinitomicaceae bacterium]